MCSLGDAADVNPVIKFLQRVSQELDWNRIDICRVTKATHIEHL
jgi:hypothetical protein